MSVQQIHHRPQMAAFFTFTAETDCAGHIVTERCAPACAAARPTRSSVCLSLGDDQATRRCTLAGNLLPHFHLPKLSPKPILRSDYGPRECPDSPACEQPSRPSLGVDRGHVAQINVSHLKSFRRVPATSSANSGCQCSNARCSVRFDPRSTLARCSPDNSSIAEICLDGHGFRHAFATLTLSSRARHQSGQGSFASAEFFFALCIVPS